MKLWKRFCSVLFIIIVLSVQIRPDRIKWYAKVKFFNLLRCSKVSLLTQTSWNEQDSLNKTHFYNAQQRMHIESGIQYHTNIEGNFRIQDGIFYWGTVLLRHFVKVVLYTVQSIYHWSIIVVTDKSFQSFFKWICCLFYHIWHMWLNNFVFRLLVW